MIIESDDVIFRCNLSSFCTSIFAVSAKYYYDSNAFRFGIRHSCFSVNGGLNCSSCFSQSSKYTKVFIFHQTDVRLFVIWGIGVSPFLTFGFQCLTATETSQQRKVCDYSHKVSMYCRNIFRHEQMIF